MKVLDISWIILVFVLTVHLLLRLDLVLMAEIAQNIKPSSFSVWYTLNNKVIMMLHSPDAFRVSCLRVQTGGCVDYF